MRNQLSAKKGDFEDDGDKVALKGVAPLFSRYQQLLVSHQKRRIKVVIYICMLKNSGKSTENS